MTTERVRWRAATSSDVEFLTDVAVEATRDQGRLPADFDEAEYRAGFAEWTAQQVRGEVPGSSTFVIEVDGLPAGRLRLVHAADHLELAGIQLLPRRQSHGVGTYVVRELMNQAGASGLRFELNVEKDNPRARALYERLGLVWESETDDEDHLVWPAHTSAADRRSSRG